MSTGKIARKKTFTAALLALFGFCLWFSQSAMALTGIGYVGPVTVDTRDASSGTLQFTVASISVNENAGSNAAVGTVTGAEQICEAAAGEFERVREFLKNQPDLTRVITKVSPA